MANLQQTGKLTRSEKPAHGSSKELLDYLSSLQVVYRQPLAEEEIVMWLESLSCFPLSEIKRAVDALVLHPPDGWSGLPKLPDVVRQIHAGREAASEQAKASNVERAPDPSCPRCSGTGWRPAIDNSTRLAKCHCWAERPKIEARPQLPPAEEDRLTLADVLKQVPNDAAAKPMPAAKTVFHDIDPDKNKAKLERQKKELGQ